MNKIEQKNKYINKIKKKKKKTEERHFLIIELYVFLIFSCLISNHCYFLYYFLSFYMIYKFIIFSSILINFHFLFCLIFFLFLNIFSFIIIIFILYFIFSSRMTLKCFSHLLI